jgi:hypothetical protein
MQTLTCNYQIIKSTTALLEKINDDEQLLSGLGWDAHYAGLELNEIHGIWRAHGPKLMNQPTAGFGAWSSLQQNLELMGVTISSIVAGTRAILESSGRVSRAWKFGLNADDLRNLRIRLQGHQAAAKLSVLVMKMYSFKS